MTDIKKTETSNNLHGLVGLAHWQSHAIQQAMNKPDETFLVSCPRRYGRRQFKKAIKELEIKNIKLS